MRPLLARALPPFSLKKPLLALERVAVLLLNPEPGVELLPSFTVLTLFVAICPFGLPVPSAAAYTMTMEGFVESFTGMVELFH